jgi:pimeloyl-ACP methyl ester carboxylesterase
MRDLFIFGQASISESNIEVQLSNIHSSGLAVHNNLIWKDSGTARRKACSSNSGEKEQCDDREAEYCSEVPWGVQAFTGAVSQPAWKSKPSWYLVTTEDNMIPPDAQRAMSKRAGAKVVECKGSHSVYVSQPDAVASLIEEAAVGSVSTGSSAAATHG